MYKRILFGIIGLVISIPAIMWLSWFFTPKTRFVAAIIDKSSQNSGGQEHISLTWVLNHNRLTKTETQPYSSSNDYYGFFPMKNERFKIKGLERFSSSQLKQLSMDADMLYIADTYGIYNNEWYTHENEKKVSGMLYGGLSSKDNDLLDLMKKRKKLIIAESNTLGSQTNSTNRTRFEKTFAVRSTGWTARFFENLDTAVNKEIPSWMVNNYKKSHKGQWPFKKSGIVFIGYNDQLAILEEGIDLYDPMPYILSNNYGQKNLSLPVKMKYSYWFEIIIANSTINNPAANFKISATKRGLAELKKYNIPSVFPAITFHKGKDYTFYYFSGDFCDNPIPLVTSYFKGIGLFKPMFYNETETMERSSFFWNFYRPMMTNIIKDYSENKQ
ncbi:MAG: hypothetical protein H7329_14015 [Opitutaceae bacterium]|nr:hypothetical protein [Cytophagales bacterium]